MMELLKEWRSRYRCWRRNRRLRRPLTESQRERVEKVIAEFDFETAQAIMDSQGMTYWDSQVPTVDDMKRTARRLLESAVKCGGWVESGRLHAELTEVSLLLAFVPVQAMDFNWS